MLSGCQIVVRIKISAYQNKNQEENKAKSGLHAKQRSARFVKKMTLSKTLPDVLYPEYKRWITCQPLVPTKDQQDLRVLRGENEHYPIT